MPLSNTILNILSSGPYWDDYNRSKRFHRILIRPGVPVQTRELNQMQSMLQNQVEQLGDGVFKEGAALTGGNFTFANNVISIQVIRDASVDISNFYNSNTAVGVIARGQSSGAEGRVVQYSTQPTESYAGIILVPLNALNFTGGEGVVFVNTQANSTVATMTLAPSPIAVKNAAVFSVDTGTFFLSGHMVDVERQSIVLSSTTHQVTARVGFLMTETIITDQDDSSLLDPALGATNYAAPGAHRLKLTATLTSRPVIGTTTIEQNADVNFIEIARIIDGVLAQPTIRTQPQIFEDVLAERTYDESGDYVVTPFVLKVKDHNPPLDVPNLTGTFDVNALSTLIAQAGIATAFNTEAEVNDILIVNGEKRTITSIVNSSVLYVNTAFSLSQTNTTGVVISGAKYNIELEAGKAYVRGYQVATTGVTKLAVDRPRTTDSAINSDVGTFFGPFVYVTRPTTGGLFNVDSLQQVDLHDVPFEFINTNSTLYSATKIGTAYIRSLIYQSGIGDANTIYKAYLVNAEFNNKSLGVNTSSHATGNGTYLTAAITAATNSSGNFITLVQNSTSSTVGILPVGNTAFAGAKISLYDIEGNVLDYYAIASTTTVASSLFTTAIRVLSNSFFSRINTTANVSITFTDKCIRGMANGASKGKGLTVDVLSKVGNISSGNTVLFGTDSTALVFPLRNQWVKSDTFAFESYQALKVFSNASGTGDGSNTNFSFTVPTGEVFAPTNYVYENFVVANSTGLVSLSTSGVTIAGTTATLKIPTSVVGGGGINVYAKVSVNASNPRLKTLINGNTDLASVTVASSNVISDLTKGHIGINTINTASPSIVGLGVADVYALRAVYAVPDPNTKTTWVDITSRYTLDNGQRDWCYDHASLVLKPGYTHYAAANQMLAIVDFFSSSANGYFTGESYKNSGLSDGYTDIPNFTDPKTGVTYVLRDCIDFRPIRANNTVLANTASNPYANTTATFGVQEIPHPTSVFQANYDYYLPRVDRVVLTKNKEFKVFQGDPNLSPLPPADVDDGITLYLVSHKAYGANAESSQIFPFEYRRYTMKDIGKLEKRIENLEYYVQLNALEQQTLNTPEWDELNMERFKNGILVDPFASSAILDYTNNDNSCSIDREQRVLRPAFSSAQYRIGGYDPSTSSNVAKTNGVVTLSFTSESIIKQPLASKTVNINPFNVASWNGKLRLTPESDTWFDTKVNPPVSINLFNENDSWGAANTVKSFGTIWNDWSEHWTGTHVTNTYRIAGQVASDPDRRQQWIDVVQLKQTGVATRTGTEISARASVLQKNLGDRVVDLSVAPYMRSSNIIIEATGMKPGASLRAYLDKTDITSYLESSNEVRLATNADAAAFTVGESITSNVTSNTGTAIIAGISANILRVVNATGIFYLTGSPVKVTGSKSGAQAIVSSYLSVSGRFAGIVDSSTLYLDPGASNNADAYVGKVIHITSVDIPNGISIQQDALSRIIIAYDYTTHKATLSRQLPSLSDRIKYPTFAPQAEYPPTSYITKNATYTIGSISTDYLATSIPSDVDKIAAAQRPGSFYGLLRIPAGFSSGKHDIVLSDNAVPEYASTRAVAQYEATGYIKTVEPTIVSTRNIEIISSSVNAQKNISESSTVWTPTREYIDPLAQTFLIDQYRFPKGVFVSSVDLFFAKKDPSNLPVRVQIRPTNNGYPSSDVVYEEAILNGNDINVVPTGVTPDSGNSSHYTRFNFHEPVFLMPNMEYAIVIITNSFEYEVFVGEIGKTIIGDTRVISAQPYGGSFFKSQNARTWTAEQNEDLMFNINRAVFGSSGTAYFNLLDVPTENVEFDVINIQTQHLKMSQSSQQTRLTAQATSILGSYETIPLDINYELSERKVLLAGNANSFQMEVSLSTDSDALSDVYNTERMGIITVKNIIDNGQLYPDGFVVVTQGTMVSNAAGSYPLTITGDGSDAVVYANTNSTGYITSFYVSSNGSGYMSTPTVAFSNTAFSVQPTFKYNGETSNKCDIFTENKSRYITRKVTLADGFDASDIKVYFDASRPSGTNIDVYYKVLATGDTENFDTKSWTLMKLKPEQQNVYTATDKFKEYEYRTVNNIASYTNSSGTTFDRFHTFAIKIVMRSASTIVIPRIRNFRAIALDE